MRVVIDTNVLVSALMSRGTPPQRITEHWYARRFEVVTSDVQIAELADVLSREHLQKYLRPGEADLLIEVLERQTRRAVNLPELDLSPDPDDNLILATAVAGGADYLVTGDKRDLLSLDDTAGIPVVTARDFLTLLDAPE